MKTANFAREMVNVKVPEREKAMENVTVILVSRVKFAINAAQVIT